MRIHESTLKELSDDDWARHERYTEDYKITTDARLRHCPKPGCSGIARLSPASLALLSPASSSWFVGFRKTQENKYVEAECGACHHIFCAKRGADAHPNEACEAMADADFLRWKQDRPVKPCPSCNYQTEKHGGCRIMSCAKCEVDWSFKCGGEVNPFLVKCNCPSSKPFRVIRALFSTLLLVAMIIIIPLLLLFFCSIAFEPDSELIALVVFALIPLFLGVLVLHGIFYCIYAHT